MICGGRWYAAAKWYGAGLCDHEVVGSNHACCSVHQRQLSVPSLRVRLMNTSESWGVNGHTTRCTSPISAV